MIISIIQLNWIKTYINKNIDGGYSPQKINMIMLDNLIHKDVREFRFEYLFSVIIICLIWKLIEVIQFSSSIGPMIKIVQKMFSDFGNFFILYVILIIMFAIIGNVNFVQAMKQYEGMFESCLTVLDASIGNYNFADFDILAEDLQTFGDLFTASIVVTFNILILNLIIAILSNTYNQFDTKSTGLYLSKILNARDEMTADENYGAFLLTMSPLNLVVVPFVPYAMFKKPTVKMNSFITLLQYMIFIFAILVVFMIGNILLAPFAYLQSAFIKFKKFMKANTVKKQISTMANFITYLILGLPGMGINMVADLYYFCVNNFRSNLKKIIIERKKSTLTNMSIRNIRDYSTKYIHYKIKSVYTKEAVLSFRQYFSVLESLQFLMFGQHVQLGLSTFMSVIDQRAHLNTGDKNKQQVQMKQK